MTTAAKCKNCGHLNVSGGTFCSECGAALPSPVIACPVCGGDNDRTAKFCTHCRHQLSEPVTPGLYLPRALGWRDIFTAIEWYEPNIMDRLTQIQRNVRGEKLPSADDPKEPYIMAVHLKWSVDWKPQQIRLNGKDFRGFWKPIEGVLLATRCRLMAVQVDNGLIGTIWFKDITEMQPVNNGKWCSCKGSDGTTIAWEIKAPGPNPIDIGKIMIAQEVAHNDFGLINRGKAKASNRMEFLRIIDTFLQEVANIRS